MWRSGMIVAGAVLLLLPKLALATVYNFQDTEMSALSPLPVSFSFSLDTATATATGSDTSFPNVTIDENGTFFPGNSLGATFTTDLISPLFFLIDTSTTPFYSGTGTGLTFHTGTFAIADGETDGEGTLSISAASVPSVPEPATWTLLIAGVATMAAASRLTRTAENSSRGSV